MDDSVAVPREGFGQAEERATENYIERAFRQQRQVPRTNFQKSWVRIEVT